MGSWSYNRPIIGLITPLMSARGPPYVIAQLYRLVFHVGMSPPQISEPIWQHPSRTVVNSIMGGDFFLPLPPSPVGCEFAITGAGGRDRC